MSTFAQNATVPSQRAVEANPNAYGCAQILDALAPDWETFKIEAMRARPPSPPRLSYAAGAQQRAVRYGEQLTLSRSQIGVSQKGCYTFENLTYAARQVVQNQRLVTQLQDYGCVVVREHSTQTDHAAEGFR